MLLIYKHIQNGIQNIKVKKKSCKGIRKAKKNELRNVSFNQIQTANKLFRFELYELIKMNKKKRGWMRVWKRKKRRICIYFKIERFIKNQICKHHVKESLLPLPSFSQLTLIYIDYILLNKYLAVFSTNYYSKERYIIRLNYLQYRLRIKYKKGNYLSLSETYLLLPRYFLLYKRMERILLSK